MSQQKQQVCFIHPFMDSNRCTFVQVTICQVAAFKLNCASVFFHLNWQSEYSYS